MAYTLKDTVVAGLNRRDGAASALRNLEGSERFAVCYRSRTAGYRVAWRSTVAGLGSLITDIQYEADTLQYEAYDLQHPASDGRVEWDN